MWIWHRRREAEQAPGSLSREARGGARLAREVEAFLSGSSGEWYLARGREVPAWAHLNQVAHGELDLLSQLAARAPAGLCRPVSWHEAVALLAQETLVLGEHDPYAIRRIQLDRLLSLESHLMCPATGDLTPEMLVARGRACLRDHPSRETPP